MSMKTAFFIVNNIKENKPYTYYKKENKENSECSICLSLLDMNLVKLDCCDHIYHEECIRNSLKVSRLCPLCRRNVDNIENCCVCF